MLGYFADPFYSPTLWRPSRRRRYGLTTGFPIWPSVINNRGRLQSFFDDFMDNVEEQFVDLFDGMLSDPNYQIASDHPETKTEAPQPAEGQPAQDGTAQPPEQPPQERPNFRKYYAESRSSRYNGGDVIEERREKITNADGETRTITMRRIGDRWHQEETMSDKDGKTSQKESWHNIPESQMEQFKTDWDKNALGHPQSVPSVTHDQAKKE
jgi:hypothetical protein